MCKETSTSVDLHVIINVGNQDRRKCKLVVCKLFLIRRVSLQGYQVCQIRLGTCTESTWPEHSNHTNARQNQSWVRSSVCKHTDALSYLQNKVLLLCLQPSTREKYIALSLENFFLLYLVAMSDGVSTILIP